MRPLILLFLLLINQKVSFSQGLIFSSSEDLIDIESYKFDFNGFVENQFPSKASLRKYAPTPMNQNGGSCVGWATSYSAISIMINSITNTTNQTMKDLASFDPYFIYAIMKTFDNNPYCDGLSISEALKNILKYGGKKFYFTEVPGFIENNISGSHYYCDDRYDINKLDSWAELYTKPYKPINFKFLEMNNFYFKLKI